MRYISTYVSDGVTITEPKTPIQFSLAQVIVQIAALAGSFRYVWYEEVAPGSLRIEGKIGGTEWTICCTHMNMFERRPLFGMLQFLVNSADGLPGHGAPCWQFVPDGITPTEFCAAVLRPPVRPARISVARLMAVPRITADELRDALKHSDVLIENIAECMITDRVDLAGALHKLQCEKPVLFRNKKS